MPKPYPSEFRRRALDLLESGRSVRDVAASLGIAESCLYRWKQQDLIDRGPTLPSPEAIESAALAEARARIAELENEVKILRKAAAAVEQVVPPKARFVLVAELAVEGVPVKQACLALGVSRSGFYDARTRPPSARSIRQAWLTDQIAAVHEASRHTYGAPGSHNRALLLKNLLLCGQDRMVERTNQLHRYDHRRRTIVPPCETLGQQLRHFPLPAPGSPNRTAHSESARRTAR